jgi:hypothetical protein
MLFSSMKRLPQNPIYISPIFLFNTWNLKVSSFFFFCEMKINVCKIKRKTIYYSENYNNNAFKGCYFWFYLLLLVGITNKGCK